MKKPANIIIRDYQPTDYPGIERLWEETGLGGALRGDNKTVIERCIALGGKMLVASSEGGFVAGTSWMTFDGRRLHLHHFGVSPKYQRQGIGRQLALASVSFAKEMGCQIKLEVHRDNVAAISLYKNLGFEYLGDYDVYIIRKFFMIQRPGCFPALGI